MISSLNYFRAESLASSSPQEKPEERPSNNNNSTNGSPAQPLKDSNANTITAKPIPAALTPVERSPSHNNNHLQYQTHHHHQLQQLQSRSLASTPPSQITTTTSLDLENLIRKSEICSSPRHSNCEHSHQQQQHNKQPPVGSSPRQHHQTKEINTNRPNVGGYQSSSSPATAELKKLTTQGGKPSCPPTPGGGLSSLKRIAPAPGGGTGRPLQCLETLAQKAGITFEEKYEVSHNNNNNIHPHHLKMEKTQSPAQQQQQAVQQQQQQNAVHQQAQQQQQQPLQISQEQFQQLQQLQFQQFGGNMVQVKQEFPQQQSGGGGQQQGNTIQISGG